MLAVAAGSGPLSLALRGPGGQRGRELSDLTAISHMFIKNKSDNSTQVNEETR